MRTKIVNVIRGSADDQDRDSAICDVLLVLEVFIHCHEDVKLSFSQRK